MTLGGEKIPTSTWIIITGRSRNQQSPWRFAIFKQSHAGWNSGPLGRASQIFNFPWCFYPDSLLGSNCHFDLMCGALMFSLMNRLLLKQVWPSIDMEIPPCVHRFAIGFSTSMLLCWRVTTTQVLLCTQHLQVFLASPGLKYTIDPIKRLSNFLMMRLRSDARSASTMTSGYDITFRLYSGWNHWNRRKQFVYVYGTKLLIPHSCDHDCRWLFFRIFNHPMVKLQQIWDLNRTGEKTF